MQARKLVRAQTTVRLLSLLSAALVAACGTTPPGPLPEGPASRIVSLDYCADQFVLGLADRERILALSPDAGKDFSYLRAEASGLPTVRPRSEDVLALRPDLVVRNYGGGPRAAAFFERGRRSRPADRLRARHRSRPRPDPPGRHGVGSA